MMDSNETYAVLTGDLVKSSRLTGDLSRSAMGRLRKRADDFAELHPNTVVGRMDTFRHDSWQLLLERPELAFRTALFLRASLKMDSDAETKYDTRISIGIGTVEAVSKRRISDSRGEAFSLSGQGLDAMESRRLVFMPGEKHDPFWMGLERGGIPLLDCVAGDWTPTESRAVYGAINGWTQEESAKRWPASERTGKRPTRQAVAYSLFRAHWNVIEAVLLWAEENSRQALRLA
jgi:hypothetical protein